MSIQLVQQYYAKVEKLIRYGGSRNESTLRKAFQDLLEQYARSKNLELIPEVEFITKRNHRVVPDGTLKDALRQDWGYWESKDEKDDLNAEIQAKFAKGYPNTNILFEDTHTAVLYQSGLEVMRADFHDPFALNTILTQFVSYELPEVREFHKAIEQFREDVPGLAKVLREVIDDQYLTNSAFKTSLDEFLELSRKAINPKVEMADVREMVIQHVLTEDIFMRVFDEADFHRDNIVAHKLQEVSATFYTGATKRNIYARLAPYYETINARASQISDHHEKQKFLKALYENFYKAYNPKAADRLGVIYTPDEVVRFMIESTDHLLFQHFGKTLGDKYVEILDPATGTGTFITELIEYLPPYQLDFKYEHEIHCNEVAILPYYIANLNIEYTYKQKMDLYKEFQNICFVDTLDNMGFNKSGEHQMDFFGLWDENAERIKRQNLSKISVMIGNPPYNANQLNENENNRNREYSEIDRRIKETYIKHSTAQKTKLYDMYARFYRWASDRLSQNGIIAFVTNSSFIDSRTFDGFRKVIADEFSFIYVIDLGGNIRKNPKLSGPTHNVFAIQTGVAIAFLVRMPKIGKQPAKILYTRRPEMELASDKLEYLRTTHFNEIPFEHVQPNKGHDWINLTNNDWDELIPLITDDTMHHSAREKQHSVFAFSSLGVSTNRDEWVYDFGTDHLKHKILYLLQQYNFNRDTVRKNNIKNTDEITTTEIKWSASLKSKLLHGKELLFHPELIIRAGYRPFIKTFYYSEKEMSDRLTSNHYSMFGPRLDKRNQMICVNVSGRPFNILASELIVDLHFNGDTTCLPYGVYDQDGGYLENITNWAHSRFRKHYNDKSITKSQIFHYIYAVLHHPSYREKYAINLKKGLPRIPFYEEFWQWAKWGETLMYSHLNFEQAIPFPLERENNNSEHVRKAVAPVLIARKDRGIIEVDTLTSLSGVPKEVWDYKLGIYSAVEWILERYKEKPPKDPTIREKFNTYRFADYKEQVIDLILRVCTVSVETMKIIGQMPTE